MRRPRVPQNMAFPLLRRDLPCRIYISAKDHAERFLHCPVSGQPALFTPHDPDRNRFVQNFQSVQIGFLLRQRCRHDKINTFMPACRNWQTRQTQNLLSARVCGFDPRHRHQRRAAAPKIALLLTVRFLFLSRARAAYWRLCSAPLPLRRKR